MVGGQGPPSGCDRQLFKSEKRLHSLRPLAPERARTTAVGLLQNSPKSDEICDRCFEVFTRNMGW
jgi:hypothetical protein